jgi:hypothetical protein
VRAYTAAGSGVASSPVSDAPLFPATPGRTFLLQGNRLLAYDNGTGALSWSHSFTTTFQAGAEINPVLLSGSNAEFLFLVGDDSLLYKISGDGSTVLSVDLSAVARLQCPGAQSGDLRVIASPAIQLCMFSNSSFNNGQPCTDANDLVIVPTHFINCPGYNRVFAVRASDLTLPASGGVGAPGWVFGNSSTFVIDPASDDCQVVYDSSLSVPPVNNTVICGTDHLNPLRNSLWALNTHPTGAFPHLGARVWSIDGGAILGRPAVKFGTTRIYYGTANGDGSGTFRVKSLSDGSDIYSNAVASAIASPVWPEFRPPNPGLTNMTMVVTVDGVFRRFVETGASVMAEITPTTGRPNSLTTPGIFTKGVAVLPSAGRVYVGENNGTVRQMDAAVCDNASVAANEAYFEFPTTATAFRPTLDFNDLATSTDIDRMLMVDDAGEMLRFCVPDGDGGPFLANMTRWGHEPQVPAGCTTPQFAGDCTCDAQCASYAPASPCYTPVCQIRSGTEGTCVLVKAPNGTACNNANSCDCSPSHVVAGSCDATCGPSNPCDVCTDGVCIGTFRSGCSCNVVGDLACDASQGQSCCGPGVCADLRSSTTNCGQCGNACAAGFICSNGSCVRDYSFCAAADQAALNSAATGGQLAGGSAIEYTFDGVRACPAMVSQVNGNNSFVKLVSSTAAVTTYTPVDPGGVRLAFNLGGVSSTPDGHVWYANLFDPDKQSILVVDQNPLVAPFQLKQVTAGGAPVPTVPFSTQPYDDGFENRPAIDLKLYNATGQLRVFLANLTSLGGEIGVVAPAIPNGAAPMCINTAQNNWCTAGTPVEALEYSIRINGDGVLLAAVGTTLHVICDPMFTNRGAACAQASFAINLTNPATYPNTDPNGAVYIATMDRIYSIAVDRARGSIFVEVGNATTSQTVMIEDASLTPSRQVVRNVFDVQIEHGLSHGNLLATYPDRGGRLAVARNGILARINPSTTAPGGTPSFRSGQIP